MATIALNISRKNSRDAKPLLGPKLAVNGATQIGFVVTSLFAVLGAAFFLVGFTLWSVVFLRFQEFQSLIGHAR